MLIPAIVFAAAVLMIAVELRRPARRWPHVAGWWFRAILLNGLQVGVVFAAGAFWDPWLQQHRPWSADALGPVGGALLGYLAITFVYYWWHRARHQLPLLWRWLHQVHHSPQRLEVLASFYKHPLEVLVNGVLSSVILYALVGLDPQTAAYAVLLTGLAELFYHWNVPTPHALGYLFQRPEMHCVHHEHGHHHHNYSDLPLWDMLFGTFHNPKTWRTEDGKRCGLGTTEHQLGRMLLGKDLTPEAENQRNPHTRAHPHQIPDPQAQETRHAA
ncbi:MAG: sterol desaturase family protein [Planctomycetota bacterium]